MIYTRSNRNPPPPSPIPIRTCACGCENEFQPHRLDQIYLNKQHADHGYNHGKRKKLNQNVAEIHKVLRKNEAILKKYFDLKKNHDSAFYLGVLTSEGFDDKFHIGTTEFKGEQYLTSYSYCFQIGKNQNNFTIKIQKYE